jgi:hypothetical protein
MARTRLPGPTSGLMLDLDLVFRKVAPGTDDELADIEFADMEPIDDVDLIGVSPHEAAASLALPSYDIVGVQPFSAVAVLPPERIGAASGAGRGRPFDGRPKRTPVEELETEEYLFS